GGDRHCVKAVRRRHGDGFAPRGAGVLKVRPRFEGAGAQLALDLIAHGGRQTLDDRPDRFAAARPTTFGRLLLRLARHHPGGAAADDGEDVKGDRGRQGDLQTLVHAYPPRPAARISASSGAVRLAWYKTVSARISAVI